MNMLQMHFLKLLLWDTYEEETIRKVTICDLSFLLTLIFDFITFCCFLFLVVVKGNVPRERFILFPSRLGNVKIFLLPGRNVIKK